MTELLVEAGVALAIGLVIGLERERARREEKAEHEIVFGARTLALVALFGWLCAALGGWLPAAGALALAGLVIAAYARSEGGATTELATLVTYGLGLLVHRDRGAAVALGIATAVLLISKPWFERLVPRLRRLDLTSTLQLLLVLAVVLPLLPTEARDPWGVLSPRRIGLFVTLIAAIDWVGYVLMRLLGARRGTGLTGLVGGLASSTAVNVAMSQQARRTPAMIVPGQMAALLASAVMPPRILVLAAVADRSTAVAAAPPMAALAVCLALGALWKWRTLRGEPRTESEELGLQNPFALIPALKWGAFFCTVLVAAAAAQQFLGDRGVLAAGALSGIADVDAITLAASRRVAERQLDARTAALAIVLASAVNTAVKAGIALASGGRAFGADVAKVSAVALAVAIGVAVALR